MESLAYRPRFFDITELVHPQILTAIGEQNSWLRLDEGCLYDIDLIRKKWHERYGSGIYCNRLDLGLDSRGLRPPDDPDGSFYSVHKQGKAFDLEPVNGKTGTLFKMILLMIEDGELAHLNTLEDFAFTKQWVHVAKMNTSLRPLIIRPR